MTIILCTRILTLALIAPTASVLPVVVPPQTQGPSPVEAAALHARFDPSLGSLRAGRIDESAPLGALERAELLAAQERSTSLDAMRASGEPSNNEWKWLAIGAAIVLLIILI